MQIDTTLQQIKDLLRSDSVQKVLVTSGTNVDPDAVGSALAMAEGLESLGKTVTVAIEGFDQGKYAFLPGVERIQSVVGQKSLVVSIEVGQNPIEKINYNAEETTFNLILTPRSGQVNVDQIQYSYAGLTFDLIVVVDTAKRSLLGQWAEDFATELQDLPMINLDHHADNELFGTLNLIQTPPAAALVVLEVLKSVEAPITPTMATNLLAGLLSDTGGFNNANADANSLRMSAELVDDGADLHQVMTGLFRQLSVPALRLWGKVLSRVELVDPGVVVAEVRLSDIADSGASVADEETLGQVVSGLLPSAQEARMSLVLKEKANGEVRGSLRAIDPTVNVQAMAQQLGGGGHIMAAGFKLTGTDLNSARTQVLSVITQSLPMVVESTQAEDLSEINTSDQVDQHQDIAPTE